MTHSLLLDESGQVGRRSESPPIEQPIEQPRNPAARKG